ncbi:tripeptidyl-peptidase 2 [Hetaerina americana]|uniref:tripeptidyl-peptidase 2 n=1 Tax=Hetaerina americana TaxID=62018 RepID=UPI003A7F4899
MASVIDTEFPVWGLLPKRETGVTSFLNKYPEFDGRGITIAIFDSGVDPGVPGLQFTSDGKPKVIDRIDCSGAGDVDTSTVVEAKNGEIVGLTGRKLKIPCSWKNPSGVYHIGIKNAFELYPSKLKERVEKRRKEELWDPQHKLALAQATRKLIEFDLKNPQPTGKDKLKKEDLEAQIEVLNNLEKKYCDVGPAYDCVVFHDGGMWRVCIDTSEKGDLASCRVLGPFRETRDFAALTQLDQLHYSVNVHNDGNTLEIVGMCSSHGTHVASIAAAYFPDAPEKNGIAPGAQIVSLTIGDNRLGSMETGTALVRAMIRVMQKDMPIDLINMSYGEHAHWASSGRVGELMNEVIDKWGVVWVASAGNHGPALCTIGTPPDISTNSVIGVGAYVSPEMMVAEYSLRQKQPGGAYTWSSRGPSVDGAFGVSICAPGGAITSVPAFTLRGSQLMNGTSMASPHVCGAVAILLSGMKAKGLPHSPYSVKRALENTAMFQNDLDPFAQGHGLLQVEKAFEHLTSNCNHPDRDVRFHVTCGFGGGTTGLSNCKGIHIRGGLQDRPRDFSVTVEPIFAKADDADPALKINFNLKLALSCSESWIECPSHLDLMHMARVFSVRVDSTALEAGVHSTSVKAYDISCPDKGPVFEVPITVVRPQHIPLSSSGSSRPVLSFRDVYFKSGGIQRHFVMVPEDATWAVVRLQLPAEREKAISGMSCSGSSRFVIHCLQLRPQLVCKTLEFHKMVNVAPQLDAVQGFPVRGGVVLEVVVAKWWASLGKAWLDYSIEFHGLRPEHPVVSMHGGEGIMQVEVRSSLRHEDVAPAVSLKNQVLVLRPTESKIGPLTTRDVIPPGRQIYELHLTYDFHVAKATEITPNSTLLSDLLYESEFESQLWMIFDSNKQLIAAGDAYPCKYVAKVEKGDFTLRLHVRHERRDALERLTDLPLLLSQRLPSPISLDVYASYSQAMLSAGSPSTGSSSASGPHSGGKKMPVTQLSPGSILPIYIAPISNEKSIKSSTYGQYLSGAISYAKDEIGKKVDVYPFKYIIPEAPKKSASPKVDSKDKERTKWDEYCEALRDLKTTWLSKMELIQQSTALYEELKSSHPDHLAVHVARLQSLEAEKEKLKEKKKDSGKKGANKASEGGKEAEKGKEGEKEIDEKASASSEKGSHGDDGEKEVGDDCKQEKIISILRQIVIVADAVIKAVNQPSLLAYYGMKVDNRPDASKIKGQMDKQKWSLLESLVRKGCALSELYSIFIENQGINNESNELPSSISDSPTPVSLDEIDVLMRDVLKFADSTDSKVIQFSVWHAVVMGHHGRALRLLQRQVAEDGPTRKLEDKSLHSYQSLGWTHCIRHFEQSIPVRYPVSYHPF